jgi:hypothetical protein
VHYFSKHEFSIYVLDLSITLIMVWQMVDLMIWMIESESQQLLPESSNKGPIRL